VTGFIVENEIEAADVIANQLWRLSRPQIRAQFEKRFTARRMASDYLEIYRGLLATGARRQRSVNGTSSKTHRHQNGIDGGVYVGD
jgi:hypothetical protein